MHREASKLVGFVGFSGSFLIASWYSHFFSALMYMWLTEMFKRISGISSGEYLDKVSAITIYSPGQYLIVKS